MTQGENDLGTIKRSPPIAGGNYPKLHKPLAEALVVL